MSFPETGLFDITLVENDEEGMDLLGAKRSKPYVNKDSEMVVTSLSRCQTLHYPFHPQPNGTNHAFGRGC